MKSVKSRIVKMFMAIVMLIGGFGPALVSAQEEKPTVTATTSFLYDMANQLAGDYINTELIIPAGEDPHVYETKPQDLTKLQNTDLVLYHGLHFEGRMSNVLEETGYAVSETFDEADIAVMEDEGEFVVDPHFWFDIDLYKEATQNAARKIIELVPEHEAEINANLEAYLGQLDELDAYAAEQIGSIPEENRFLITPHDAFNYFSRSYNIPVEAPQGVSTDSEVANADIDATVDFIVDNQVKAIFAESTTDPARMEKLQEAVKAKGFDVKVVSGEGQELFSDSLAPEGQPGDTFIDMFRHNVDLITENLK